MKLGCGRVCHRWIQVLSGLLLVPLSVEARYAKDSPTQHAANGVTASANYYSRTPRFAATWRATDAVNLYALVARGNRPDGYFYGYFDAPVLKTEAWTAAVYLNNISNEDTPLLGSEFPNFNIFPANIKSAFHLGIAGRPRQHSSHFGRSRRRNVTWREVDVMPGC